MPREVPSPLARRALQACLGVVLVMLGLVCLRIDCRNGTRQSTAAAKLRSVGFQIVYYDTFWSRCGLGRVYSCTMMSMPLGRRQNDDDLVLCPPPSLAPTFHGRLHRHDRWRATISGCAKDLKTLALRRTQVTSRGICDLCRANALHNFSGTLSCPTASWMTRRGNRLETLPVSNTSRCQRRR